MLTRAAGLARSVATYHGIPGRRRRVRRVYSAFLRPGDLAFDVGAHVGNRVRAWRGLGARVVAVEPQPDLARVLRLFFGRDDDVTLLPVALGAAAGTARLGVSSATPTVSTMSQRWRDTVADDAGFARVRWDSSVEVRVDTLDALIAEHGVPAFCKIDVEGFEAEVLDGLPRPLPALSVEYLPAAHDATLESLERIEALGRYVYRYSPVETMTWDLSAGGPLGRRRRAARTARPAPSAGPLGRRLRPPVVRLTGDPISGHLGHAGCPDAPQTPPHRRHRTVATAPSPPHRRHRTVATAPVGRQVAAAAVLLAAVLAVLAATTGAGALRLTAAAVTGVLAAALLVRAADRAGEATLGPAGVVTLTRGALAVAVVALVGTDGAPSVTLVALAVVTLALDGVDGAVARRTGTATALGARFDMETDAFLLLVLSVHVAATTGRWWVTAPGLFRYVFVAAGRVAPWLRGTPPPRCSAKVVAVLQGVVLVVTAAGVLPVAVALSAVAVALAALTWSFGVSVVAL